MARQASPATPAPSASGSVEHTPADFCLAYVGAASRNILAAVRQAKKCNPEAVALLEDLSGGFEEFQAQLSAALTSGGDPE